MSALTAKDWESLETTGKVLLASVPIVVVFTAALRWRKGEPLLQKGDFRRFIENFGFIFAIFIAMPASEIVERITGSETAGLLAYFAAFMLFILPPIWIAKRRMDATAQAHGINNPEGLAAVPSVPQSPEEKRIGWYMIGGMLVVALILMGSALATTFWALDHVRGAENVTNVTAEPWRLPVAMAALLLTLAAPLYAVFGRWPGRVSSKGEIEIAATPDQIWDKLKFRAGMEDWKGVYHRIERLDEPGEVYRLHYFADASCTECGLPKHPDDSMISQRVEILEAAEPHIYRTRSFPKGVDSIKGDTAKWLDCEEGCHTITPLPGGGCKVHLECAADQPKIWIALLIKLGGPVKESLGVLKAHLEGGADSTIYQTARDRFAAARLAPRHCGCAKGPATAGLVEA